MKKPWIWIPGIWFVLIWIHGATLGISDDEAYYWTLAQRPDWGYAFHPPMVAWAIVAFQKLFAVFGLPQNSAALIRLPAAFFSAATLSVLLKCVEDFSGKRLGARAGLVAAAMIVSIAGIFGSSWMMVPDLPLFLGVVLLLWGRSSWALFFGAFLALNSKYSGVLAIASAAWMVLFSNEKQGPRNWNERIHRMGVLAAGTIAALIPILVWNAKHEWGPLLYQFQERHGGSFSFVRGLRAWMIQLILAGPIVGLFVFRHVLRAVFWSKSLRELSRPAVFTLPPLIVFGIQPFFSDFKAHWLLVAWLPIGVLLGQKSLEWAKNRRELWLHGIWGGTLILASVILLHFLELDLEDPKKDITNDLRGWSQLRAHVEGWEKRPWVGSRYQTASHASVALFGHSSVTLLPRDRKQRDEWPDLEVTDSVDSSDARLLRPIYFVADNRYSAGPNFRRARCKEMPASQVIRHGKVVKKILIWACDPTGLKGPR